MGSGTTAVSATLLNRKWLGFETESEYNAKFNWVKKYKKGE